MQGNIDLQRQGAIALPAHILRQCDFYLSQSTNTPSTIAILHCGNFTSNFLITICFRGIIIPALLQKVKPRILPRIRRNFKRKTSELYYSVDISE
ncbi:MAG: hypothetical protein ACYTXE_31020 [Nostoc sp.]